MNNGVDLHRLQRPPLGFIVEGKGEYYSYPSIVPRIVDAQGFKIPIANANGIGNIIRGLPKLLDEIVLADHPCSIIITADLRDVLKDDLFPNCADLISHLAAEWAQWLNDALNNPRLHPLPDSISAVVQIQQFETWFIADIDQLVNAGYVSADDYDFANVDAEIETPASWLNSKSIGFFNLKNPRFARKAISEIRPAIMRGTSPSFDKFFREVSANYLRWLQDCGIA